MLKIFVTVYVIYFAIVNGIGLHGKQQGKKGHGNNNKRDLKKVADDVVRVLEQTILEMNNQNQLTDKALSSEPQKIEVSNIIDAKINSDELKKFMDQIKRRDEQAKSAPSLIYNKLMKKMGHRLGHKAKQFLKSPIESSVKKYILKQEVAGTPIEKKEVETTIEELADRVVDILKTVVLEMAKNKQLSKEALSDKDHKSVAANIIEEKINSAELKQNMDRIKRRDSTAEVAPNLIYDKLIQTVKGQLGDDPESAEAALQAAIKPAVKNYIVKQETIVPPQAVKEVSAPTKSNIEEPTA